MLNAGCMFSVLPGEKSGSLENEKEVLPMESTDGSKKMGHFYRFRTCTFGSSLENSGSVTPDM
jgi:hypothetical protein